MRDRFEEIERQQFGKDGYEDAVAQIGQIEQTLGLADLAQFTAPREGGVSVHGRGGVLRFSP